MPAEYSAAIGLSVTQGGAYFRPLLMLDRQGIGGSLSAGWGYQQRDTKFNFGVDAIVRKNEFGLSPAFGLSVPAWTGRFSVTGGFGLTRAQDRTVFTPNLGLSLSL